MSRGYASVKVGMREGVSSSNEGWAPMQENRTRSSFKRHRGLAVPPLVRDQGGGRRQLRQQVVQGVHQGLGHLLLRLVQVLLRERNMGLDTDGRRCGGIATTGVVERDITDHRVFREIFGFPFDA